MTQRLKNDIQVSRVPSVTQLKQIEKSLEQSFAILILECGSFCREMKELLSGKLNLTVNQALNIEGIHTPTINEFKQATISMNQDLKSVLSLTKILLSEKSALTEPDSNEYKILKSCFALNQLSALLDQFFAYTDEYQQFKPDIMSQMKSLSDNIYSYQSSNPQFNDIIQQFATRSPSINLSIPTSMKSSRASDRNVSLQNHQTNDLQIQKLRRLIADKQLQFEKNNEQFSICIEEYNRYIYELKDEIADLSEQVIILQKQRQELKQHNLILLKSNGVLPQRISNSRVSMRNTNRRFTLTEYDQRPSLRRSQAPSYRASTPMNNQTSFMSMSKLLTMDKK